jgi:hypothetical protein
MKQMLTILRKTIELINLIDALGEKDSRKKIYCNNGCEKSYNDGS